MSVATATDLTVTITHYDAPDPTACVLDAGLFRMDDIVTAECGSVAGTIVRFVDYDPKAGTREVVYEARLDGSEDTAGFCNWSSYTPVNLAELANVAQALEAELAVLR